MPFFVFENRAGDVCRKLDISVLTKIYPDLELSLTPEQYYTWCIQELKINLKKDALFHLKRMKSFLDEGMDKGYKLVLDI